MTPTLETPRLILRPLELADADQAQVLFPQWEVVRYLTHAVPWPYPQDGAYKFYRDVALPAVERGDEWAWTLRLKHRPDQLIGAISLMRNEKDNRGFWLGLPWQRQGLVSEASDVVTDYWFDILRFPVMRISKAVANTGSRRISENKVCTRSPRKSAIMCPAASRPNSGRSRRKSGATASASFNEDDIHLHLRTNRRSWQNMHLSTERHQGRRHSRHD